MKLPIDILGWIGAVLILLAYALISFKKVEGNSIKYQLLNVVGSCRYCCGPENITVYLA